MLVDPNAATLVVRAVSEYGVDPEENPDCGWDYALVEEWLFDRATGNALVFIEREVTTPSYDDRKYTTALRDGNIALGGCGPDRVVPLPPPGGRVTP